MKLLLDENLSRRLVPFLQEAYPNTSQVVLLGLEQASDEEIREYAKQHDFVIVTHDSDFYEMNLLYGQPPKIIWLKTGNQSKNEMINTLLQHKEQLETALLNEDKACVEIY